MSSKQKGRQRERQAEAIYEAVGYRTFRPRNTRFGDNDLFNLFDIAAFPPCGSASPVVLAQVKSNRATGIEAWADEAMAYESGSVRVQFLVCYDGHGGPHPTPPRWRLLEPEQHGGGTETIVRVDEREDEVAAEGDGVIRWLGTHLLGEVEA